MSKNSVAEEKLVGKQLYSSNEGREICICYCDLLILTIMWVLLLRLLKTCSEILLKTSVLQVFIIAILTFFLNLQYLHELSEVMFYTVYSDFYIVSI